MYYINTLKQELSSFKTYDHNLLDDKSVIDRHRYHMAAKFGVFVNEDYSKLPTLYWLPKLHERPYKSKKGGKDQLSIRSSTIPDPGYRMGM